MLVISNVADILGRSGLNPVSGSTVTPPNITSSFDVPVSDASFHTAGLLFGVILDCNTWICTPGTSMGGHSANLHLSPAGPGTLPVPSPVIKWATATCQFSSTDQHWRIGRGTRREIRRHNSGRCAHELRQGHWRNIYKLLLVLLAHRVKHGEA